MKKCRSSPQFLIMFFLLFALVPFGVHGHADQLIDGVHYSDNSRDEALPSDLHHHKKGDYRATHHTQIAEWRDLKGGQYVIGMGYNAKGDFVPLAIYDKTFPRPAYIKYWRNLFLGTIGINDLNLGKLANYYDSYRRKEKEEKALEYINGIMFEEESHVFHANWWKDPTIKWKSGKKPSLNGHPPSRVPLSDLELATSTPQSKERRSKFRELYAKFHSLYSDDELPPEKSYEEDLIEHGDLVRQSNGQYKLVMQRSDGKLQPTKVVDLQGRFSSYWHAMGWGIFSQLVKQAANFVPVPGLSQVAYAAMERFFNLVEITYLTRHAMAREMIMEAIEGNEASPFYGALTESEMHNALIYLERSSTMLSSIIKHGFTRKWNVAVKYIDAAVKHRTQSLEYLEKHNYKVYPLDKSFYALGIRRDESGKLEQLKIFSLIKSKFWGHKPHDVVDFLHPKKERAKRNLIEAGMIATSFTFIPFRFGVSLIRIAYKEIFVRELHRRMMVEAGFRAHMNHNRNDVIDVLMKEGFQQELANHMIDVAYRSIYKREMNPMDVQHQHELEYTTQVENWIRVRYPAYQPIPLEESY